MLDFGSLLATLLVLQLLQAAGFAFVYRANRGQVQARDWALGSALIAAGALLVLLRDVAPPAVSILAGNFAFYAGILIFDAGIVRAAGAWLPRRPALALLVAAAAAQTWFALVEPSISARVWILSAVLTACNAYTLAAAWRASGSTERGILRLIAALLALEIAFSVLRALMTQGVLVHVLQSTPGQTWPLLGMIATRFLLTLVLALLMSERLQAGLRHAAMHDPLTGLLNRRAFADIAEREWSRLRRHGGTAAALMIDLDHFKRYNDRNGHAAGDQALRDAARAIVGEMRREDHGCRYGGEEFAVLLPGTSSAQALRIAERLRDRIASSVPASEQGAVTASIGLAQSQAREGTWEALLETADRALYQAKSQGRNRVVASGADPMPVNGPIARGAIRSEVPR
jgi:diguanylate cyclase (GGDEF)-like protein